MGSEMSRKRILRVMLALAFGASAAISQGRLDLSADYALFRGTGDHTNLEVYYSIPQSQLTFVHDSTSGGMVASALVLMRMVRGDQIVMNQTWKLESRVAEAFQLNEQKHILDQRRLDVVPGRYKLSIYVTDISDPEKKDSTEIGFEVPAWGTDQVKISDIEMCSSLKHSEPDGMNLFYKNSYEAIPQPERVFGKGLPVLFYYLEVYNMNGAPSLGSYDTRTYVSDRNGSRVEAVKEKVKRHQGGLDAFVEVGSANIAHLSAGSYFLNFSVSDTLGNSVAAASKKFFVLGSPSSQSMQATADKGVIGSRFAVMPEADLDQEFEQAHYLSTDKDRSTYESLKDVTGKREFLFHFWQSRDPDPSTPENELYTQHEKRLEFVRDHLKSFQKEGWKTDRGRVYLQYGPPDEVERYASSEDTKPYEIWHYNSLQGGVIFVFGDRTNFGNYYLVHSTAQGEISNPNWHDDLRGF
jgi:GWxTD domain-containing protein